MNTSTTIKDLRIKAGLTQKEIADEVGCSQPNISYLENRTANNPRDSHKIVNALKRLVEKHKVALSKAT
jgi:transcriptional regulator with XRE-family HTH domain